MSSAFCVASFETCVAINAAPCGFDAGEGPGNYVLQGLAGPTGTGCQLLTNLVGHITFSCGDTHAGMLLHRRQLRTETISEEI